MEVKCCKGTQQRGTRNQIANQRNQWSKCQHPLHHRKKQKNPRKKSSTSFFFIDYPKVLTVWITTNWKIVKEMGIPDHLTCLLRNLYAGYKAVKQLEQTWKNELAPNGKGVHEGCILWPCLFNLCRVHSVRCWAGWSTSWNQACWERYQ